MAGHIQKLLNFFALDFYAGYSFMDLFRIGVILIVVALILNYFFSKAGSQ